MHHRPGGEIRSPRLCNEGTRRKEGLAFTWRRRLGPSLPAREVKFLRGPEGGPYGGPGLAHKSRVGLDNVIKRASPESRSSDFWLGVMRDGSNWNHGSNFCEN